MKLELENPVHGKWYNDACGGAFGLELLGERWSALIVRELMFGSRRFTELRGGLPTISAKALTERLHGLEHSGIVRKVLLSKPASRKSPTPEPVQAYELTPWGYQADQVLLSLCRWALASPGHDHTLFLSPAAMMMSLRALFEPGLAADVTLSAAIRMGHDEFAVHIADGRMDVARGLDGQPAFIITAPGAGPVKRLIYGKAHAETLASADFSIVGDRGAASRFVALFHFPAKWT